MRQILDLGGLWWAGSWPAKFDQELATGQGFEGSGDPLGENQAEAFKTFLRINLNLTTE
jgi:hypothetical protein